MKIALQSIGVIVLCGILTFSIFGWWSVLTPAVSVEAPAKIVAVTPDFAGVVSIHTQFGAGSGLVVARNRDGYLVATAAHVVQADKSPVVVQHAGEVVAIDVIADVAIIRVPDKGQNYVVRKLANSKQGESVTALGFTYRSRSILSRVCYKGYVITTEWLNPPGFAAANCGGYPGLSGGPVFNRCGQCIGLVIGCAGADYGTAMDSTVLIVPSREIQRLIEHIGE